MSVSGVNINSQMWLSHHVWTYNVVSKNYHDQAKWARLTLSKGLMKIEVEEEMLKVLSEWSSAENELIGDMWCVTTYVFGLFVRQCILGVNLSKKFILTK